MIWKCLIVDDEQLSLKIVEKYSKMVEQLEVVATCNNAFKAIEFIKTERIDLIFLDIKMPELLGTSFIRTLAQPPKVIFITSYPEFAVEAFELNAIDYLLKPLSLERFLKAVNKVINMDNQIGERQSDHSRYGHLYFSVNRKMVKILLENILYIESVKDHIKIYRDLDTPLLVKQSLISVQSMLPPHQFLRIHRSFIVPTHRITAFTNHDVEIGKIEIPIGRQFFGQLKKLALQKC
ncbi:two component transcriptional regulator, LytTR family [Pedobacter sp. ok626]|uniref:LytR/AlgR family response regulator transcription factor n=1 Tax=Pedobacter sp. ok626 TaxID=1761882 RepID=UPI000885230B|nr:LytTR family DNA-binding domain-containing protein [Pedobacter sp. ok626]SDK19712.1 two component transcriptional regulator, LytTR family [Pedobacter sp. ok626]